MRTSSLFQVNEVELRGKDVNEVCDLLANMQGTLTFLVVPTRRHMVGKSFEFFLFKLIV